MKTKTIYRLLEATFLFILILMIYIMSIFSAQGQMAKEIESPLELQLSYSDEHSFIQERMMGISYSQIREPKALYPTSISKAINTEDIKDTRFQLPKNINRVRRNQNKHQAPSILIPFN
jgi:hypothetical protein